MDFKNFPKMPRCNGELRCVITEKIDGTNCQIYRCPETGILKTGSRNRWIDETTDHYDFNAWVRANLGDQIKPGSRIFGEWWGKSIQRSYGQETRFFTPFSDHGYEILKDVPGVIKLPVLYEGAFDEFAISDSIAELSAIGSKLIPGWMNSEGIVIYFPDLDAGMKWTYDGAKWALNQKQNSCTCSKNTGDQA